MANFSVGILLSVIALSARCWAGPVNSHKHAAHAPGGRFWDVSFKV